MINWEELSLTSLRFTVKYIYALETILLPCLSVQPRRMLA